MRMRKSSAQKIRSEFKRIREEIMATGFKPIKRLLILKAAKKHKKDPGRISTVTATRLINYYSSCMSVSSQNKIECLYEELLDKIAQAIIPYRPNRNEPRMKRRDLKHYPILHTTRAQWRSEYESTAS